MEYFLLKIILEIEPASTLKLQNAADAAFCNFSVEADSISSQFFWGKTYGSPVASRLTVPSNFLIIYQGAL